MEMASKRKYEEPEIIPKTFTVQEIETGIRKLQRRIAEVQELEKTDLRNRELVHNVERSIRETIREVYGHQSPEFHDHQYHDVWEGAHIMGMGEHAVIQNTRAGIPRTITMITGLIKRLEEKRLDLGEDPTAQIQASFRGLQLHHRIAGVAQKLFDDGHYADAVFNASKALINLVKEKSGNYDLDGASLMRMAFSKNSPTLVFNGLADQTDLDEQEGMMHLFEGAVLGIRNPRGHAVRYDSPQRALEFISMLSLLANLVDEAKVK
jgi:uncharacterized protein (TIGR02391 family)